MAGDQCIHGRTPEKEDWLTVRWSHIRGLRRQTKYIVLFLAIREAFLHGLPDLIFPGQKGYPAKSEEDYGIVYTVAYILSYIFLCLCAVFLVPLLYVILKPLYWLLDAPLKTPKKADSGPTFFETLNSWLRLLNVYAYSAGAAMSGLAYVVHLFELLLFVDERKEKFFQMPNFRDRKLWRTRATLLLGIAVSLFLGYYAVQMLAFMELARIKPLEYALIVIPVQINIGVLFATKVQKKAERRAAARQQRVSQEPRVQLDGVTIDVVDEKKSLPAKFVVFGSGPDI